MTSVSTAAAANITARHWALLLMAASALLMAELGHTLAILLHRIH